jgi:hypothetical protein
LYFINEEFLRILGTDGQVLKTQPISKPKPKGDLYDYNNYIYAPGLKFDDKWFHCMLGRFLHPEDLEMIVTGHNPFQRNSYEECCFDGLYLLERVYEGFNEDEDHVTDLLNILMESHKNEDLTDLILPVFHIIQEKHADSLSIPTISHHVWVIFEHFGDSNEFSGV